jgi:hypothetical protein
MNQSLSTRSIVTSASVVSMAIVWVLFVLPGTSSVRGGLLGVFTVVAAMWVTAQLTRWMALAPPDRALEPLPVVAVTRTSSQP